jgi:hypothetical protein
MRHTYSSVCRAFFCFSGYCSEKDEVGGSSSSYFVFVAFYCLLFCFGPFHFEGFPPHPTRVYSFTLECTSPCHLFLFLVSDVVSLSWLDFFPPNLGPLTTIVLFQLFESSFRLLSCHRCPKVLVVSRKSNFYRTFVLIKVIVASLQCHRLFGPLPSAFLPQTLYKHSSFQLCQLSHEDGDSMFLRDVCIYLRNHKMKNPRHHNYLFHILNITRTF